MNYRIILSIVIVIVLGVVHSTFVPWAWGLILGYNIDPLANWLLIESATNHMFKILLLIHDYLINLILCIPLASLVFYLKPKKPILYSCMALLPSFIQYSSVIAFNPILTIFWVSMIKEFVLILSPIPLLVFIFYRAFGYDRT